MKPTLDHKAPTRFPFLQGILPITAARVPSEIIAGITLAAIAVPEVMGYTSIAGMPVITGLYTILIPIAVFAVLGSSRHLVVGGDSATAAIMYAGIASLGIAGLQPGTSQDFWHDPKYSEMLALQQEGFTSYMTGQSKSAQGVLDYIACGQQQILFEEGTAKTQPSDKCSNVSL